MSRPLDRIVSGPVAAVRPWLFAKALYLLLAFDVWHTLVGPGWRYGAAGFNVAHFAILDALPIPTREAYLGNLVLVGAMSFVAVCLPRTPRALAVAIAVFYTWGWSCSMLDSYQHHYLVTLLLVAASLFPRHDAIELFGYADEKVAPTPAGKKKAAVAMRSAPTARPGAPSPFPHGLVARVRSVGWTLAMVFTGIVYAFTARSKWEPDWISGDALRNITHDGAAMPAVMSVAESLGIDTSTFFRAMGLQTIVVQIACALGYLTASLRDGPSSESERAGLDAAWRGLASEWTRITIAGAVSVMIALVVGIAFHAGAGIAVLLLGLGFGMPRDFHRFVFAPVGRPRLLSVVASIALLAALSFHVGAEYIGLQIGWFSYYMIALALAALTPAHWLAALAALVTSPLRTREASFFDRVPLLAPVLGLIAAGAAAFAGVDIDLPGTYTTSIFVGLVALALGVGSMLQPRYRPLLGRASAALGVGMIACWLSMTSGNERYDFYRFAGGDFRRRHEYRAALEAYREANRYAPQGESREDRIREMEEAIRREGTP